MKKATAQLIVNEGNTAKAALSGSLDIFATPMMIALMEQAACKAIAEMLQPGQTSVGTDISVSHISPSPIGASVTATATVMSVEGRKVTFQISACDNACEIGSGTHTRVIVDAQKLLLKAQTKIKGGQSDE